MEQKLAERAAKRKLEDLTIGPVLTWTTEAILKHLDRLLQIPGAVLLASADPPFGNGSLLRKARTVGLSGPAPNHFKQNFLCCCADIR